MMFVILACGITGAVLIVAGAIALLVALLFLFDDDEGRIGGYFLLGALACAWLAVILLTAVHYAKTHP